MRLGSTRSCWTIFLLLGCGAEPEPAGAEQVSECGCGLNADYVGSAKYTYHQVFEQGINDKDEDTIIEASSVVLATTKEAILLPQSGTVTLKRTVTVHPTGTTCVFTTTGSAEIAPGPQGGSLQCVPPPMREDKLTYYATGTPMVAPMRKATISTCSAGSFEDGGALWLLIPSLYSGAGYSTVDFKFLRARTRSPLDPEVLRHFSGTSSGRTGAIR